MNSGEVIEFCDEEIERLQREAAARLGYRLVGHRLELFAVRDAKQAKSAGKADAQGGRGSCGPENSARSGRTSD